MNKLLTVVVPVYKVEKYINKCLDSLIVPEEQMKKLEVIVVNDGTPDNSSIMAKEYEKRYPETFKVIDKENGGHGSAWNKGVELATSKYLRFLDSDDWLSNISEFISSLEKFDVDLIFTGVRQTFEDGRNDKDFMGVAMNPGVVYDVEKYDWTLTNNMYNGHNVMNFQMCTYKTDILKRFHPVFLEKMYYDDEILFALPLLSSKSFVYFDFILYNYLLGRVGQTMDPKVMARNIDFKIKTRKYLVNFCNAHPAQSDNVRRKIQYILNSRIFSTYFLMAKLPYKISLRLMKEFTDWLKTNYILFDGCKKLSIYRMNPSLFWFLYHFIQPIYKKIKLDND